MPEDNGTFDLEFRPRSYWVYADARQQLAAGRDTMEDGKLLDLLDTVAEEEEEDGEFDARTELDLATAFLGRLNHPAREGEAVEIANIFMFNPNCDYISVLAEWRDGKIRYSVVDNYPQYWSYHCTPQSSEKPLTFGELIDLIDTAELVSGGEAYYRGLVFGVLEDNLEESGDAEALRRFIRVTSAFYDDLEVWYMLRCDEWCLNNQWDD